MLKDHTLLKRTGGELLLRLSLTYTLVSFPSVEPVIFAVYAEVQTTAVRQLVSRRQQRYITEEESFKLAVPLSLPFSRSLALTSCSPLHLYSLRPLCVLIHL